MIQVNADFHYRVGLTPRIVRRASASPCEWCAGLAGSYEYPNVPKEVYQRHQYCRCVVEYDPGGSKKRQNVHTKRWTDTEDDATMKSRKKIGLSEPITHEFRNRSLLGKHFEKHASEYGVISIPEYLRQANLLANAEASEDVAVQLLPEGIIQKYRFTTNDFIALNGDGTIRTFFKPEKGKEYWENEIRKSGEN